MITCKSWCQVSPSSSFLSGMSLCQSLFGDTNKSTRSPPRLVKDKQCLGRGGGNSSGELSSGCSRNSSDNSSPESLVGVTVFLLVIQLLKSAMFLINSLAHQARPGKNHFFVTDIISGVKQQPATQGRTVDP